MTLHPKIEPLREVLKQLDAAPPYAKLAHARQLVEQTIELLAATLHRVDALENRVIVLERFPEIPSSNGGR